MTIKKQKDTFNRIRALWPEITNWISLVAKLNGLPSSTMDNIIEKSLELAKEWNEQHPFGSVDNRSTRTMVEFIKAMDAMIVSEGKDGCIEYLPEKLADVLYDLLKECV